MPALKCSVGIQRKSRSGFQPLRRGKMPRPLFEAEPRNLADIVSRVLTYRSHLFGSRNTSVGAGFKPAPTECELRMDFLRMVLVRWLHEPALAVQQAKSTETLYRNSGNFSKKGGTRECHKDKPPRKNFYTDKHG